MISDDWVCGAMRRSWLVIGLAAIGAGGAVARLDDGPGAAVAVREATVRVGPTAPDQNAVARRKEHGSIDLRSLAAIGAGPGRQVRVSLPDRGAILFTVGEARDEGGEPMLRAGPAGLRRLGDPGDGAEVTISADVTRSDLSDDEARRLGELVERLDDDGDHEGLIVLAPHGGQMERHTDAQADRVRDRLAGRAVSCWRVLGYTKRGEPGAFARWHITSTDLHEESFPMLGRLAGRRYAFAVSFHGMSREGIVIGGAAPTPLKRAIRDAVRERVDDPTIPIELARPGDSLGGFSPKNIVNRYCPDGGVQIEQGPRARREHWQAIADAVAEVFADRLDAE